MVEETLFQEKLKELRAYYAATGFKLSFEKFLAFLAIFGILLATAFVLLLRDPILSLIGFLTIMSLSISIPLTIRNNRIETIEQNLPDVLKHMALVLKAGGTTETALEEVASADYGPISKDLRESVKQMREGKSFDIILTETAANSGSTLFKRTALIIIDAKRAGAGLADVMFSIAEDARDVLHIKRERKSRTTMHVLFLGASALVLSPFIFGFAISIVHFISSQMVAQKPGASAEFQDSTEYAQLCNLHLLLTFFIVFQAVIAVLSIGLIREGKFTKFIAYTPIVVLCSLFIFLGGKMLSAFIVSGPSIECGLVEIPLPEILLP